MSSDRLKRKRRSEIDISDDSADEKLPVKILKKESTSSFVKAVTETISNFFKWIAPKFFKKSMIVDSQVCSNMGIADPIKSNCIEDDDDEISVIAVQNGAAGARPPLYNVQRMAIAPMSSRPSNATICPLASTPNNCPFYSHDSLSRKISRTMEHRKTNGFPTKMTEKRKVGNQKIIAPITNPISDIEILLEGKMALRSNEIEIVAEVHSPENSTDSYKKSKFLSYSQCSKREKVNYAEELITGTSSLSLSSRSTKSFTAHEVVRLQEKAQYKLLLDKVANRSLYSPAISHIKSPPSPPQIDLTDEEDKPGFSYHFKKEKVEHVNDFLSKCYKPCALVPHSFQRDSHSFQNKNDSEDDVQIIDEMPKLKPTVSSTSSNSIFTDAWINDLKMTISTDTERRLQRIAKTEGIIKFYERRREAKIAEGNRKLEELRLAGVILPEDVEMEELVLPEITPEMETVIARAFAPGPPLETLSDFVTMKISRTDAATLCNLSWLNDEVINCYMMLVAKRSMQEGYPTVFAYNSFFYSSLKIRGITPSLLRWTKKTDIFSHDLIMVPLHLEMHWALLVVDNRSKTIKYYDSMGSGEEKCLYIICNYLAAEMMHKRKAILDPNYYNLEIPKDIPKQMNGSDCGMFTLKYAEYLSRDAPFTFSQENMPYFRQRMVYELMVQQLL